MRGGMSGKPRLLRGGLRSCRLRWRRRGGWRGRKRRRLWLVESGLSGEEAAIREHVRVLRRTQNGYWAFIPVYGLGAYPSMGKE